MNIINAGSKFLKTCNEDSFATKATVKGFYITHVILFKQDARYTRNITCSVTAFNSTDIKSVQDNVATPVTAMMATVCISTDALSSVLISPDLSDINSFHQCCWSIIPVTACSYTDCNSLFPTYLYHFVTSDWYSPDNPKDCSSLISSVLNSL